METESGTTVEELLRTLLEERAELDRLISALQKRLGPSERVGTQAALFGAEPKTANSDSALPFGLQTGQFFGLSRPEAAIALLTRATRPLSTNEIVETLKVTGYDVSGKNVLSAFYTALKRHPELRRVAKNTWGLKKWYPNLKDTGKKGENN